MTRRDIDQHQALGCASTLVSVYHAVGALAAAPDDNATVDEAAALGTLDQHEGLSKVAT